MFAGDFENLVENKIKFALHDFGQIEAGNVVPVIGDTVLGEVVGADAFAPVAGTHLGTLVGSLFCRFFGLFDLKQTGVEDTQCDLFVAVLGFFLLTGNGQARGDVGHTHS